MDKLIVSPSPHLHTKTSTKSLMRDVVIALLPAVVVSVLFYGWSELLVLGVSVASCVLLEYLITKFLLKTTCTIGDWSAVITGVLLALNLPATTPWWVVFIGAVVAIGVAKMTFGGLGQNLFNPAIVGRVFLLISVPTYMTDWTKPQGFLTNGFVDAYSGATPLGLAKEGGVEAIASLDYCDMLFLNNGTSDPVRAQGAFLDDPEIESIVEALKVNGEPQYAEDVQAQLDASDEDEDDIGESGGKFKDPMTARAVGVIKASGKASTSLLQRKLSIGYGRAAKIIDELEELGYIGPDKGQGQRDIFID